MKAQELPPCRECGACCSTSLDEGVVADLDEDDAKRLGPRRLKLYCVNTGSRLGGEARWATQSVEHEPSGMIVCRALRGTVGKRVSCRIYEDRPVICSSFERGSRGCLEMRKEAGL